MNNVTSDGRLDFSKRRRVPGKTRGLAGYHLRPGDVLFNMTNSPELVGKSACFDGYGEPVVFSNHFLRLRPDHTVLDPRFLARWLNLQFDRGVFRAMCRQWVNQATVSRESLLAKPIELPPVEEQRRIAAILDKADDLRAKRRAALAHLDGLTESLFFARFGAGRQAPVTIGERLDSHERGWSWELLADVAQLATGHTPDRARSAYWSGDIPWISLTEIRDMDGKVAEQTDLRVSQAGIDHSSAVVLPAGTVCVSRTASIGFVTIMGRPMATSQDFVNWVCSERIRPTYLMHSFLRSRRRLRSLSTGSTHKTIYMRVAERFMVLMPPISEQLCFEAEVAELARTRARSESAVLQLDSLFASLQHRAFLGAL